MTLRDSIEVLLRVRTQREAIEERKLAEIVAKLRIAQDKLAELSMELDGLTRARITEIQAVLPATHHSDVETHSKSLWLRCAEQKAEIEKLKQDQAKQTSAYLSAYQEREIVRTLHKQRRDAVQAERQLREQKLNEDLFLARRVAKRDR